jgi:hypothetical protein
MRGKLMSVVLAGAIAGLLCAHVIAAAQAGSGNDRVLTSVTFIHFRKAQGKPGGTPGGGKKAPEGYYSYISKGAKWRTVEDYRLNLTAEENAGGALDGLIQNAVAAGMEEWETPGSTTLAVFRDVVLDSTVAYNDGAYRGYNTISFGLYGDSWVIGVTTVWGYFSGPSARREIVEAHILLNDEFQWGDASADGNGDGSPDSFLMDIQNIVTHELGHVAGMGDVYETAAGDETMYGYSTEGELKKRHLYKGDVTGVTKLYQ